MHPFLPKIPGFHPLPPPSYVRMEQEARCAALGRLLAAQTLVDAQTPAWLAPALRAALQALRSDNDDARRRHGPRLNTLPRPLDPRRIAEVRNHTGANPIAQAYALLDGPDLTGLDPASQRRLTDIRQRLRASLREAGERDPATRGRAIGHRASPASGDPA